MTISALRRNRAAVFLLLGTLATTGGIVLSNASRGSAEVSPDASTSCSLSGPCQKTTNNGKGAAINGTASVSVNGGPGLVGSTTGASVGSAGYQWPGIYGKSVNGNGIYASSVNRNGGYFENSNPSFYALFAQADDPNGYLLGAVNVPNNASFFVDPMANVFATSFTSTGSASRTNHRTSDGRRVTAFGAESSSATLEDFGSGNLVGGSAVIALERTFRSTINSAAGYSVFITPNGDNRGLYVVKSPGSFVVREAQGGRSTLAFDYRIVAHPGDASSGRLPAAASAPQVVLQGGRAR